MGKIGPYSLGSISTEADAFCDDVTTKWNNGKYAPQIVTSPPTWAAQPGEQVLFFASSGGTTNYFYKNSAWVSSWSVTV